MDRPHERILGTVLVVVGVAILLFAFYHAYGLLGHLPSSQSSTGPEAGFAYSVTGFTVTLTDQAHRGSAPISSTYWQFSDGNSSGATNTSHTYTRAGNYNVTLIVEDKNGVAAESFANLHVGTGASSTGQGSPSVSPGGSIGSILGNTLGGSLDGIASTAETFILLTVMWLVGGSILKAGWNLITPKSETIQVRVKPKSLQVEGVGYSAMPPAPTFPAAGAPPPDAAAGAPSSVAASSAAR
ncbi:MAG TPA: PKD domain-containing protein [Thermoplasmata archaeon]|nr:PKD domain-containing protein [Thermoplasmata archaeon]